MGCVSSNPLAVDAYSSGSQLNAHDDSSGGSSGLDTDVLTKLTKPKAPPLNLPPDLPLRLKIYYQEAWEKMHTTHKAGVVT